MDQNSKENSVDLDLMIYNKHQLWQKLWALNSKINLLTSLDATQENFQKNVKIINN